MKRFFTSSILTNSNTMHVWRYGKGNYSDDYTHYVTVDVRFHREDDNYSFTIRQQPISQKKGAKIIDFICDRKDLEALLKIAKLHSGVEI